MRTSLRLRLCLLAAGMVPAIALASCGGDADKPFATLKGDGFTISMPGKPKRTVESVDTAQGTLTAISYTSAGRDDAFSLGYTELPNGVKGDLHGAIVGGAEHVSGKIADEVGTTYGGFKARDARISGASDNKNTIFVRALFSDSRLYVLQYIGKGNDTKQPPATYRTFLRSFKIG
jgi:hypothetical protein